MIEDDGHVLTGTHGGGVMVVPEDLQQVSETWNSSRCKIMNRMKSLKIHEKDVLKLKSIVCRYKLNVDPSL